MSTAPSRSRRSIAGGTNSSSRRAHMIRRTSHLWYWGIRSMWKRTNDRYSGRSFRVLYNDIERIFLGDTEAGNDVVSVERQHSLFRDISQGGYKCGTGIPDSSEERTATGSRGTTVSRVLVSAISMLTIPSQDMWTTRIQSKLIERARSNMAATANRFFGVMVFLFSPHVSALCHERTFFFPFCFE